MNTQGNREILERAARRASDRPFFVASVLALYRSLHGIGEEELAEFLGCSQPALSKLALCRRPDTTAPSFRAEVEQIASYVGLNGLSLARLFREVESVTTLRGIQSPQADVTLDRGLLMAARDRTEDDTPQDTGES